jgi:hypothetical protein
MKTALFALCILGLAFAPNASPLAALRENQKQALYTTLQAGLEGYTVAFTATEWKADPRLVNARLIVRMPEEQYSTEGLPPDAGQKPEALLLPSWRAAAIAEFPPWMHLELLSLAFRFELASVDGGTTVTATRLEGSALDAPARIRLLFDDKARVVRLTTEDPGSPARVYDDIGWVPVSDRWRLGGYTITEGERKTVVKMDYTEVKGISLLRKTSLRTDDGPEKSYAYEWRAVEVAPPPPPPAEGPFATPEATVRSFIDAAQRKDPGMLAKCLAENCDEEFRRSREQKLSSKDLDEFAQMFGTATVKGCKMGDDGESAIVTILMSRGGSASEEQIELARDEFGEWQIVRF